MNSESEQKLSMDELLHRNIPANIPPMQSQPTLTILDEQWKHLLNALYKITDGITLLTQRLDGKSLPTASQMAELVKQINTLNNTLKQPEPAGKKHAKHISTPSFHLPPISLLLMLPLSLLVLAGLWLFLFGPLSAMTILP